MWGLYIINHLISIPSLNNHYFMESLRQLARIPVAHMSFHRMNYTSPYVSGGRMHQIHRPAFPKEMRKKGSSNPPRCVFFFWVGCPYKNRRDVHINIDSSFNWSCFCFFFKHESEGCQWDGIGAIEGCHLYFSLPEIIK